MKLNSSLWSDAQNHFNTSKINIGAKKKSSCDLQAMMNLCDVK